MTTMIAKLDQLILAVAALSTAETTTAIQAEQKAITDAVATISAKLDSIAATLGTDSPPQ